MKQFDPSVQDGIQAIPADKFKMAFVAWWAESQHQGWDGFSQTEVQSFEFGFMNDFVVYCQNGGLEDYEGWLTFGSQQVELKSLQATPVS